MRYISYALLAMMVLVTIGSSSPAVASTSDSVICGANASEIQWHGATLCQHAMQPGDEVLPIYQSVKCPGVPNRFYVMVGWKTESAPNAWLYVRFMPVRIHRSQFAFVRSPNGKIYTATQTLDLWRIGGIWISHLEYHLYRNGLVQRQIKSTSGLNVDYYADCG
jgi:hypothetical protein